MRLVKIKKQTPGRSIHVFENGEEKIIYKPLRNWEDFPYDIDIGIRKDGLLDPHCIFDFRNKYIGMVLNGILMVLIYKIFVR